MPDPIDLTQIQIPVPGSNPPPDNNSNPDNPLNPIRESFIANVSDEHKDIVSKYLPDWDAQVTQQFQKIHEEYQPYKDLGADIETLQAATKLLEFADADPKGFYEYVKDQLIQAGIEIDDMDPTQNNPGNDPGTNLPEFEGLDPQFVDRFSKVESGLEKISKFVEDFNAQQESQKNQQQLETLLKDMHTKHGDFDEPAILGRIMQGMSPEDAVKDYQSSVNKAKNSPPPPPILGNGGTALDQVDRSKLKDEKSRKAIVADLLTKAAQQS